MVEVKKGDLVLLEYTGSLVSTGEVFETTDENVAKESGIYQKDTKYGPKLVLFGSGSVMEGVEDAIRAAQLGKEENFLVRPEKGFGNRIPGLVRIVPYSDFSKQGIQPKPGMVLTLDGVLAKIKSVGSGRVIVDFNHPMAGESLLYKLKVLEVISDDKKKIMSILSYLSLEASVSEKDGKFEVSFPPSAPKEKVEAARRAISSAVPSASFA
ncbi:MAG: peptidylprolyl isomerase [Candidatus Anstonellaceae archaeon]